mmetsp:Transcript_24476/g.61963  ORF Transcript_24476/g.61963 Transcript_24476/m.61963 type:complete len:305 (-) Transcript_24476:19-933(-)
MGLRRVLGRYLRPAHVCLHLCNADLLRASALEQAGEGGQLHARTRRHHGGAGLVRVGRLLRLASAPPELRVPSAGAGLPLCRRRAANLRALPCRVHVGVVQRFGDAFGVALAPLDSHRACPLGPRGHPHPAQQSYDGAVFFCGVAVHVNRAECLRGDVDVPAAHLLAEALLPVRRILFHDPCRHHDCELEDLVGDTQRGVRQGLGRQLGRVQLVAVHSLGQCCAQCLPDDHGSELARHRCQCFSALCRSHAGAELACRDRVPCLLAAQPGRDGTRAFCASPPHQTGHRPAAELADPRTACGHFR